MLPHGCCAGLAVWCFAVRWGIAVVLRASCARAILLHWRWLHFTAARLLCWCPMLVHDLYYSRSPAVLAHLPQPVPAPIIMSPIHCFGM